MTLFTSSCCFILHFARDIQKLLKHVFPGRWIYRRSPIELPARSPDLTPLDYFLCGYLKTKLSKTKPDNLQDLNNRIAEKDVDIDIMNPVFI